MTDDKYDDMTEKKIDEKITFDKNSLINHNKSVSA